MAATASEQPPAPRGLDTLLHNLTAGVVCGFLSAVLTISFANLLLPPWLRTAAFRAIGRSDAVKRRTILVASCRVPTGTAGSAQTANPVTNPPLAVD